MFYTKLLELYMKIKMPHQYKKIFSINGSISFYQADVNNSFISGSHKHNTNYILEIDITSSFPTICNQLFKDTEFIKRLNSINEKKSKNIYISTTLSHEELQKLNLISKLIICGIVFEFSSDIILFELKKDSLIFCCSYKSYVYFNNIINNNINPNMEFITFVTNCNFKFHIYEYIHYIRSNKTSIVFTKSKELIVKGKYKLIPNKLKTIMKDIFENNKLSTINEKQLILIYHPIYWKITKYNMLLEVLNQYYYCDTTEKILINEEFKYTKLKNQTIVDPKNYLKLFIYPILRHIN